MRWVGVAPLWGHLVSAGNFSDRYSSLAALQTEVNPDDDAYEDENPEADAEPDGEASALKGTLIV